ncbi:hypothetical protein [Arthrobacter rhizosphaerae]|nr:hypothetical protein [Arthrobacter rhizosphaerae]
MSSTYWAAAVQRIAMAHVFTDRERRSGGRNVAEHIADVAGR